MSAEAKVAGPRFVRDMPAVTYHACPGVSNSGLLAFGRSPAFYYKTFLDPRRPVSRVKAGQLEGTLAHCATLEPTEFLKRYVVGPVMNRNTIKWKEWVEANTKDGRQPIQSDEYDTAIQQADSIRSLPEIKLILASGEPEVSVFWQHEATGVQCRCRPDWMHQSQAGTVLLDVKTYGNADPNEFRLQIANKAYHQQAAFYSDGVEAVTSRPVLAFIFVAVETQWPFGACAMMLDPPALDEGRALYRRRLGRYAECLASNEWPGYSDVIQIISLPKYAFTEGARA
jgi:exodeoxyribonuclease VIII